MFKGKPSLISNDDISLPVNRFCQNLSQIMCKGLFLTMTIHIYTEKQKNRKTNWEWVIFMLIFASKYILWQLHVFKLSKNIEELGLVSYFTFILSKREKR